MPSAISQPLHARLAALSEQARRELPAPPPEAQALSARLRGVIEAEIRAAGGAIPFHRFMELALYAPGLGYYSAGSRKLGAEGDFITAPEVAPLFARTLARSATEALGILGGGDLLEVGAGSGAMAAELLASLGEAFGGTYYILELSAELKARQAQSLRARGAAVFERVVWLDAPPVAFEGVVLANELLDAMPVCRFAVGGAGPVELHVGLEDERLVWCEGPWSDARLAARIADLEAGRGPFAAGYVSEVNLAAEDWVRSAADWLARGIVLLIDYGYPRSEYYHQQREMGTLMCHYRHRAHPDPFAFPGLQDITAHVDFTSLAAAAHGAGLEVCGFTTQAQFLLGSGLTALLAETPDAAAQLALATQVKRLTLPQEMGETFKVLGLCRGMDAPLSGFALRDLRPYL